jgi:hypothetical protein
MGSSKGSSTVEMTPEQRDVLATQASALKNVFMPAYTNTIGGAGNAYNTTNPAATTAAQTALNVAGQTGALQQAGGTQAYQTGLGGQEQTAGYQQGLGQGLTGAGASGVGNTASYQQGLGQGLTGYGSSQLAQLFSPDYKSQQIQASMQPAREDIREQVGSQNALFGGSGNAGSSRYALARENLSQLGEQRLGTVAAATSAGVEQQRQNAANALLGAGQGATGQAGGLYSSLLGAGQTATGAAQQGYGGLSALGGQGLTAATNAAGLRVGLAQTPQDVYNKYASVVFGVPQASTTPNFAGTQGATGKSSGFKL